MVSSCSYRNHTAYMCQSPFSNINSSNSLFLREENIINYPIKKGGEGVERNLLPYLAKKVSGTFTDTHSGYFDTILRSIWFLVALRPSVESKVELANLFSLKNTRLWCSCDIYLTFALYSMHCNFETHNWQTDQQTNRLTYIVRYRAAIAGKTIFDH